MLTFLSAFGIGSNAGNRLLVQPVFFQKLKGFFVDLWLPIGSPTIVVLNVIIEDND